MRADRRRAASRVREGVIWSLTCDRCVANAKRWSASGVNLTDVILFKAEFHLHFQVQSYATAVPQMVSDRLKSTSKLTFRFQTRRKRQTEPDSCCNKVKSGEYKLKTGKKKWRMGMVVSVSFLFVNRSIFKKDRNLQRIATSNKWCLSVPVVLHPVTLRLFRAYQALYTGFTQYFATVIIHTVALPTSIILLKCLCAVSYWVNVKSNF